MRLVLRFEAIAHNTRQLRCGRSLERFPEIVTWLHGMCERFCTTLDCAGINFIPRRHPRQAEISAAEVSEAIERLFGYYWRTARDWATPAEPCLTRHTRPGANAIAAPAISVGRAPMPPESQQRVVTLGWFEEHRELLLACIDHARDHHLDQWVVRLTSVMAGFLRNNGPVGSGDRPARRRRRRRRAGAGTGARPVPQGRRPYWRG